VPLLIGAAVGRRCAAAGRDAPQRLRVLGVAAAVAALGSAVLGALAGGRLGAAAFDPVDVPAGGLAVAVLTATLLGGAAALLSSPDTPSTPDTATESSPSTEPSTPDDTDSNDIGHGGEGCTG
jgi:hypothetical protein